MTKLIKLFQKIHAGKVAFFIISISNLPATFIVKSLSCFARNIINTLNLRAYRNKITRNIKKPQRFWTLFAKSSYLTSIFADFFKLRHPQIIKAMVVPLSKNLLKCRYCRDFSRFIKCAPDIVNFLPKQNGLAFARYRVNETR